MAIVALYGGRETLSAILRETVTLDKIGLSESTTLTLVMYRGHSPSMKLN